MAAKKTKITIEEAISRLEEITGRMEKETLSLDEMMKLYQEGQQLEKECRSLLDTAEKKIRILTAGDLAESEKEAAGQDQGDGDE